VAFDSHPVLAAAGIPGGAIAIVVVLVASGALLVGTGLAMLRQVADAQRLTARERQDRLDALGFLAGTAAGVHLKHPRVTRVGALIQIGFGGAIAVVPLVLLTTAPIIR
jgi:hypothetical protein